jgi:hypothetical protein
LKYDPEQIQDVYLLMGAHNQGFWTYLLGVEIS